MSPKRNTESRRFAYLLWYLAALGAAAAGAVWIAAKMARTDEADFRLLLIGAVVLVGALALVASAASRR